MSTNNKLFVLTLLVIIVSAGATVTLLNKDRGYKVGVSKENDKAVGQARALYELKKDARVDFTDGPCLSNDLLNGWVLDLVHKPRIASDNLAENQCAAYLEGRAKHYVEMDLEGNIIKVK